MLYVRWPVERILNFAEFFMLIYLLQNISRDI